MIEAIIFDMNGVIIDDERIHQEAWRQFCTNHDLHFSEDNFKRNVFGRTEKDTFEYLYGRAISPDELEAFSNERVDTAIAIIKPQIKLADGLAQLLQELSELSIHLAVATSSRRQYCSFVMDALNIGKYFRAVITAEDIAHGKPDPEIYLKAAAAAGDVPGNCEAVEDSLSGIQSAQAAGMQVTAIASTHEASELQIAERVIGSFTELDAKTLLRM
jgi:HAD superfamily hydrolase (TIGR01509 family)